MGQIFGEEFSRVGISGGVIREGVFRGGIFLEPKDSNEPGGVELFHKQSP